MDFVTTFPNGFIDRYDIFVEQPLFYKISINFVCKLLKANYSLKQFSQIWYQILYNFFYIKEFIQIEADYSIFICWSKYLIINIYFDNLLVIRKSQKKVDLLKKILIIHFKMTNFGLITYYHRLHIIKNLNTGTMFLI